ncbi:MAG: hypothetical protein IT279_02680 [Ignavibacteriaceae bacterium]|nr:hypothetical protein [Ignavibacteriaceae bacterium]
MNKLRNLFLTLITFTFITLITGCDSKENAPKTAETDILTVDTSEIKGTPVTDNSFSEFDLSYNVQKGNTFLYKLTSITDELQSLRTDTVQEMRAKQQISYLIEVKVEELEADKTMELSFTFKEVAVEGSFNEEKYKFLSSTKNDTSVEDRFLEYQALINNPFNARIDRHGNIAELYRTTKIADKIIELRKMKDSINAEQKQAFIQDITDGALRPVVMQLFRKLPEAKVAKDSTWYFPQQPASFQIFAIQNTHGFKLASFEKSGDNTYAVIDASLISKSELAPEAKSNGISMKNTGYSGSGKLYFNIGKGVFEKSKTSTTLTVELDMKAPPGAPFSSAKRKQKTNTTNILQLVK